jgi:hypothetical protein
VAILDKLLIWIFTGLSLLSLAWSIFAFYRAMKAVDLKDEGFRMFLWAAGGLVGLVVAGMSAAYILLPIIFHYQSR